MYIARIIKSDRLVVGAMLSHCTVSVASNADLILPNSDIYRAIRRNKSVVVTDGIIDGFCDTSNGVEHSNFVQIKDNQRGRDTAVTFERSSCNWFPTPSITWIVIKTFLARHKSDSSHSLLVPEEGTPPERAINLFTVSSDTHLNNDEVVNSNSVGLFANFILVDNKPFNVPRTEIHNIRPLKRSLLAKHFISKTNS